MRFRLVGFVVLACIGVLAPATSAQAAKRTTVELFGLSNTYPGSAPNFALQVQIDAKKKKCRRGRRADFFFKKDKLGRDNTDKHGIAIVDLGSPKLPPRGKYSVEIKKDGSCRSADASGRFDGGHFLAD